MDLRRSDEYKENSAAFFPNAVRRSAYNLVGPSVAKKKPEQQRENMGELFKRLREERDLTQQELADKAGVSVDAVRNYEQMRRIPTIPALRQLAGALGLDYHVLADAVPNELPKKPDHTS